MLFARLDCIVDAMYAHMDSAYAKNIRAFYDMLGPKLQQPEGMFNLGWRLWPVGRLAFPIFSYCLTVGLLYTHDIKRY